MACICCRSDHPNTCLSGKESRRKRKSNQCSMYISPLGTPCTVWWRLVTDCSARQDKPCTSWTQGTAQQGSHCWSNHGRTLQNHRYSWFSLKDMFCSRSCRCYGGKYYYICPSGTHSNNYSRGCQLPCPWGTASTKKLPFVRS